MLHVFFYRRSIFVPTLLGCLLLLVMLGMPLAGWWFFGEEFLATTERRPADALVVEGWIGPEGIRASKAEFDQSGYRYLVATGGLTGHGWNERRWSVVDIAERELLRLHLAPDRFIAARANNAEDHRTYESAVAARQALHVKGIHPKAINVFTLGAHARRSRLTFAKAFGPETEVGVVAWFPPGYETEPWWKSSERAEDMLKETVGYFFELLLNSGRWSNKPVDLTTYRAKRHQPKHE